MFALAGHLGRTVGELEATMSYDEFAEWAYLMAIEPWGYARLDALCAMQQHASLVPWTKGKIDIADLIPKWGSEPKQAGNFADAARQIIERARALANGNTNRKSSNCPESGQ